MIRIVIVDDEPLARKGVAMLLEKHRDFHVVASCEDGISAIRNIEQLKPDLVFMDIQMPGMNGFEVMDQLTISTIPLVIFVTAYDEFALKAFQSHAVDYLLKPVKEDNFIKALRRVRLLIQAQNSSEYLQQVQQLLADVKQQAGFMERFLVREKSKLLIVPVDTVTIIKARNDYVELATKNEKYLVRDTLTRLETKLDPDIFIRINRSVIIRKSLVKNLQALSKGDYKMLLTDNQTFKLSRNYSQQVLASFK